MTPIFKSRLKQETEGGLRVHVLLLPFQMSPLRLMSLPPPSLLLEQGGKYKTGIYSI